MERRFQQRDSWAWKRDIAEREESEHSEEEEEESLRSRISSPGAAKDIVRKMASDDDIRLMFGSLSSDEYP